MIYFIVNPMAGTRRSLNQLTDRARAMFEEKGFSVTIRQISASGDIEVFSREAASSHAQGVVVFGGDGSIYEAVNGLCGSDVCLYFAPCGTGNDLIHTLGLPADPEKALALQLSLPETRMDLGRINDRIFANVSGTGLDVRVLEETERFKGRYHGIRAYLRGVYAAVHGFSPIELDISVDGGATRRIHTTIISIGNGRYIGGGMKSVPDAIINDGLFDVVIVPAVNRLQIRLLLPLFIFGLHVKCGLGRTLRCRSLTIHAPGTTYNLDGELIKTDTAKIEILPKALKIRCPIQ